jgi:hypothetical protein
MAVFAEDCIVPPAEGAGFDAEYAERPERDVLGSD